MADGSGGAAGATLRVRPRYYRWYVDPGVEWTEANTRPAYLDWNLPVSECALVLIDVWNAHYLRETKERTERIIKERLRPLVEACRRHGLPVVHAPSPPNAHAHPQWVGRTAEGGAKPSAPRLDTGPAAEKPWPPPAFRRREGRYAAYARPQEPREAELREFRRRLVIHPDVEPVPGEAVIATGEELHRLCRERGTLFLFFAGFNTNACILERDYSLRAMAEKGYACLLVRDCTTGMESYRSLPTLGQTEAAIEKIEMFLGYTVSSPEMIAGFEERAPLP